MAIDKESNGIPEVDLERRTTKGNLTIIAGVGLFIAVGVGLFFIFGREKSVSAASSVQGPFLVAVPILLVVPALYFLFTRKPKGGSGRDRSDATERAELTGSEQAKHREPK